MTVRATKKLFYFIGGIGLGILFALIVAGLLVPGLWHSLQAFGYLGAFLISVAGGATVIVPIPMLPVVAALGGALRYPWLVGLAAALGETVGALSIYATGRGGGEVLLLNRRGRFGKLYDRLSRLMSRRGWAVLFLVSAILSPLFYPVALTTGALRYEWKRFSIVVLSGKLIKCLMVAYLGHFGIQWLLHALGR